MAKKVKLGLNQAWTRLILAWKIRTGFEVRMGMFDIKHNYKNKYSPNLKCRVCNEQDESLQHFSNVKVT